MLYNVYWTVEGYIQFVRVGNPNQENVISFQIKLEFIRKWPHTIASNWFDDICLFFSFCLHLRVCKYLNNWPAQQIFAWRIELISSHLICTYALVSLSSLSLSLSVCLPQYECHVFRFSIVNLGQFCLHCNSLRRKNRLILFVFSTIDRKTHLNVLLKCINMNPEYWICLPVRICCTFFLLSI